MWEGFCNFLQFGVNFWTMKKNSDYPNTRIQRQKRPQILEAALKIFSTHGYRGSTLDQIALEAKISKPNLPYYYKSKQEIHKELINGLMQKWLAPLREMKKDGEPIAELRSYIRRKIEMARDFPRESRLFNNEITQGAPHIKDLLEGELKELVEEKAKIISAWMEEGKLRKVDAYHLIFSIWATTQHYADFDVQVCAILGEEKSKKRFDAAAKFLEQLYIGGLKPEK